MFKTIVVVDGEDIPESIDGAEVVRFEQYLSEFPKRGEPPTRIINLCDTSLYLSRGYYCSLLAEARQHKVLPSVGTINDLRQKQDGSGLTFSVSLGQELLQQLDPDTEHEFFIFFGQTHLPLWKRVAKQIFAKYPSPILHVAVRRGQHSAKVELSRHSFSGLSPEQRDVFLNQLQAHTGRAWRAPTAKQKTRWDLAILINPEEKNPPSDREALRLFVKAANKVGINAEFITSAELDTIGEYDALFIRETTAIDHHTYIAARRAEQEGLVVIDDSTSILRCCNKVFLHDAFTYSGVPSLRTMIVTNRSNEELDRIEASFPYPIVLKVPDGSFSRGVFKVQTRAELSEKLDHLLKESSLVLAQEYLYTAFDWRIGVLDGRPLYACRYHMARNHWQIFNHRSRRHNFGGCETLPTFEVPRAVVSAALKASKMIGKSLYGVDLKQRDDEVFVIEVNDNPNIDHGYEDRYLGNELYMQVMAEFGSRLESRGRT
jgi:glutathione synthase/RimK-type ligase-like ATP-grasp enzyme